MKFPRPAGNAYPEMRAIIDAAHGAHEPNELARVRVRRGIEGKLVAGLVVVASVPVAATMAVAAKVTLAVVAIGTIVGAGLYALPRRPSTPAPSHKVTTHTASRTVAPPTVFPAPHEVAVVAPAAVSPRRRHVTAPPAPRASVPMENAASLREETALLGAARAALGRGDWARAEALLNDYDRLPGLGALAEERTVTGIFVSCAAGRIDAARADALRFRSRWPRSPSGARVDRSCAGAARPAQSGMP